MCCPCCAGGGFRLPCGRREIGSTLLRVKDLPEYVCSKRSYLYCYYLPICVLGLARYGFPVSAVVGGGGGGCAGGGVPLGAVPVLSWCGEVSLGGIQSSSFSFAGGGLRLPCGRRAIGLTLLRVKG